MGANLAVNQVRTMIAFSHEIIRGYIHGVLRGAYEATTSPTHGNTTTYVYRVCIMETDTFQTAKNVLRTWCKWFASML